MSEEPTEPKVKRHRDEDATSELVSGEAVPPPEHTERVRSKKRDKEPPTHVTVHDREPPSGAEGDAMPTSRELAERTIRERRRQRDRRAERVALLSVAGGFVALGAFGFLLVSMGVFDSAPSTAPAPAAVTDDLEVTALPKKAVPKKPAFDVTPEIPALRQMLDEGLTIAAEGLPEVLAENDQLPAVYAAIETCRFAFAIWEYSPNKRFRFMTTCQALEGQVNVGAYELDGTTVRMSPIVVPPVRLVTVFEVEKPSRIITQIYAEQPGAPVLLMTVNQKVTTIRPGMEGEAFRATYEPRNTIILPGTGPRGAPAKAPQKAAAKAPPARRDPMMDLLKEP